MSDLSKRLRAMTANSLICCEAADEIERLRAIVERLESENHK